VISLTSDCHCHPTGEHEAMYQYIWPDKEVAAYPKICFSNYFALTLFFIVCCWTQTGWLKKKLSGEFFSLIQFTYLNFAVDCLLNQSKVW